MDALERAIAEIQQMGNRPDPVAQRIKSDARIALLRRELAAAKFAEFDFGSAQFQREARVRRLMQVRRLQITGRGRNDRIELLKHAASCRLVEKRIEAAEQAWPHEVTCPGKLGLIAAVQSTIASAQI